MIFNTDECLLMNQQMFVTPVCQNQNQFDVATGEKTSSSIWNSSVFFLHGEIYHEVKQYK